MAPLIAATVITSARGASADNILATKAPPISAGAPSAYDWTGFYIGGHLGYAWGNSNWTASSIASGVPSVSGSLNLLQRFDPFDEAGSFFGGLQIGYDFMLPNRLVVGAEVDTSFAAWPNLAGISIGGTSTFSSPAIGPESYSDTLLYFGTVRARLGYAPGDWLFYATGGLAWTYDQPTLTQLVSGTTESAFLWRFWLGGRGWRRVPGGTTLDRAIGISV
jgi:high affinity Mn2+ porin